MLRFHLDENVDHSVARGLQARGIDVTTSTDAKLLSVDDETQLAYAFSENRVLITHDGPLLGLATRGVAHAGASPIVPKKPSASVSLSAASFASTVASRHSKCQDASNTSNRNQRHLSSELT